MNCKAIYSTMLAAALAGLPAWADPAPNLKSGNETSVAQATNPRQLITRKGVVSDQQGQPIAGVKLELTNEYGDVISTTASSSAGAFQFQIEAEGIYSVRVAQSGFKAASLRVTFDSGVGEPILLTLSPEGSSNPSAPPVQASAPPLPANPPQAQPVPPTPPPAMAGSVSGVIKDALGRPLKGVLVTLRSPKGAVVVTTTTDDDGSFSLATSSPNFTLELTKSGYGTMRQDFSGQLGAEPLSYVLATEADQELVISVKEERISGPGVNPTGTLDYSLTNQDIKDKPQGEASSLLQVLTAMPGVSLDQNQQVHIRDQHNNGQYRLNGILLPLDLYAEPAFVSFINPQLIKQIDLLTGILPAQFGFASVGGVIDIQTKDGAENKGGTFGLQFGQRGTFQPMLQYGGTEGDFSYYVNGQFLTSNTAFSSATPYPEPIHDRTDLGQGFGLFSYKLDDRTKASLMLSTFGSNNQLPDVPGLPQAYNLSGVGKYPSQDINSYFNFHDFFAVLALQSGRPSDDLKWQLAASVHNLDQDYRPDNIGELIYQGVAASVTDQNRDQTLQGDVSYKLDDHLLSSGFYIGKYGINTFNSSQVFNVDANGNQSSNVPRTIVNNFRTSDTVQGYYLNDLWQITDRLAVNLGVRADLISGFTTDSAIDPTINFIFKLSPETTLHAGYARYMDTPAFQAFSPAAQASFNGTTNAAPPGQVSPNAQHDHVWDAGMTQQLNSHLTLGLDAYYELNRYYGDEGQFGVVPIFVNLNYDHGHTYGAEMALKYKNTDFSSYLNFTYGRSMQYGVSSGQFNFTPEELTSITKNGFSLDHQPLYGVTAGFAYNPKPWTFSLEFLYSSGLHASINPQDGVPSVIQFDLGVQRQFGEWTDRISIINAFDRTNLIRPANGIGVYQAAYGPRFTIYDTITIPIH